MLWRLTGMETLQTKSTSFLDGTDDMPVALQPKDTRPRRDFTTLFW